MDCELQKDLKLIKLMQILIKNCLVDPIHNDLHKAIQRILKLIHVNPLFKLYIKYNLKLLNLYELFSLVSFFLCSLRLQSYVSTINVLKN